MLVDTHAHLEAVKDLEGALERAKESGVNKIITIGTSLDSSRKALEIAESIDNVYASVGIHPQDGKEEIEKLGLYQCINTLKQIAESSTRVVAIGECGLDYRFTTDPSTSSGQARKQLTHSIITQGHPEQSRRMTTDEEKGVQIKLFEEQVKLAAKLDLPLVVHCRNAWNEIFDILSNVKGLPAKALASAGQLSNVTGVFHSWTGDWQAARKALDLGFYISFSGIVTFGNAQEIQEAAREAPLDRILVETDSPFLAPYPLRGAHNEPKNVKIVGKFLAEIRKEPFDLISSVTTANAVKLFRL